MQSRKKKQKLKESCSEVVFAILIPAKLTQIWRTSCLRIAWRIVRMHDGKLNGCRQRLLFARQLIPRKCSLCSQGRKTFSYHGHALVTLYVQFLYSDWSKIDRWVHSENLCIVLKVVYFESWSWQSLLSTCDVFNCLFPLDVQNEIQLLSRVFCYSLLVCLLGFWLREMRCLSKFGNRISDGIVFVFHLA